MVFQVLEMLGGENMPYIVATHDPLCHINSGPGEIGLTVHICEWTAVVITRALCATFPVCGATSFWKRGSFRSGSNIGSSRSSAGVSGIPATPVYGSESTFCKAAMARSGSPMCAATRARISIDEDQSRRPSRSDSLPWPVPTELTQRPCRRGPYC